MTKPKEMELAMQSSYADGRWNVSLQAWIGTKKAARRMMDVLKVAEEMLPDELPDEGPPCLEWDARERGNMSVHDAKLDDLYVDESGKLWRVMALCGEPTVHVQEVETMTPDSPVRRSGGVSGLMWRGFKRIHRPEPKPEMPDRMKYRLDGSQNWQS